MNAVREQHDLVMEELLSQVSPDDREEVLSRFAFSSKWASNSIRGFMTFAVFAVSSGWESVV